jgi:hypothetical protein
MEDNRARFGKLKALDIVHYIQETIEIIVHLKDEEMMMGIYDEHKRQESRKLKHIKNFAEYRCKNVEDREQYASEVLFEQKKKK